MSVVEVWQEPSRLWRWRYLEPSSEDGSPAVELLSNEVYERREAAVEAAMTAYPGVAVRELEVPPGAAPGRARRRGGIGAGGRLLALLGLAAVVLAWRRHRRSDR
jgi:hypothetical protein